jgi:hypothetical protein
MEKSNTPVFMYLDTINCTYGINISFGVSFMVFTYLQKHTEYSKSSTLEKEYQRHIVLKHPGYPICQ